MKLKPVTRRERIGLWLLVGLTCLVVILQGIIWALQASDALQDGGWWWIAALGCTWFAMATMTIGMVYFLRRSKIG